MRSDLDVLMVLENNRYPHDSRVRKEAETLTEAGLVVEVLAPREYNRPVREVVRGVRVTRYPLLDGEGSLYGTAIEYLVALIVVFPMVFSRLVRCRAATLHVHNPPDLFFPVLWLARWRGWGTVFDHHDDAAGILRDKLGRATPMEKPLIWMRNLSARAADLTIVTNDTQRVLLQDRAQRAVVVRNGPPAWFADHRSSPPSGRSRLVFLGELGTQDRADRAVELLARLLEDFRLDVELLIIGDGPQRHTVEARARELGVADRVTTTGWVPYEQVPVLLSSAHVGIDTAELTEVNHGSTMIKILEYLAVGLPVVASGLRETKVTGAGAVITVDEARIDLFAGLVAELLIDESAWRTAAHRSAMRGRDLRWPTQAAALTGAYPLPARTQSRFEPVTALA